MKSGVNYEFDRYYLVKFADCKRWWLLFEFCDVTYAITTVVLVCYHCTRERLHLSCGLSNLFAYLPKIQWCLPRPSSRYMTIDWRIPEKIIVSVLCCFVPLLKAPLNRKQPTNRATVVHNDMHAHMSCSYSWLLVLNLGFAFVCCFGFSIGHQWFDTWLGVRKSIWPVKKMNDEVLAWLSVWSKVQMICMRFSWCHCHTIISCFIKIQIGLIFVVLAYSSFWFCFLITS